MNSFACSHDNNWSLLLFKMTHNWQFCIIFRNLSKFTAVLSMTINASRERKNINYKIKSSNRFHVDCAHFIASLSFSLTHESFHTRKMIILHNCEFFRIKNAIKEKKCFQSVNKNFLSWMKRNETCNEKSFLLSKSAIKNFIVNHSQKYPLASLSSLIKIMSPRTCSFPFSPLLPLKFFMSHMLYKMKALKN